MTDHVAEAYAIVRDNTVNNDEITNTEALGVLELVAQELREEMLHEIRREAMNR